MALTKIQEEKWASTIVAQLETLHVATRITNRAVQIEGSDKFHIVLASDVSSFTVADGSDITYDAQTDTSAEVEKNFDQGFALLLLDTNKMQTQVAGWEQTFISNGSYQIGQDLDAAILGLYTGAGTDSYETGSTDWQFTKDTCADIPGFFAKIRKTIRDAATDGLGKPYIVGPTGFGEAVDTYVGGRESVLGDQVLLAGGQRVFDFNGFNCYVSNNCVTAGSVTHGLAGVEGANVALGMYMTPDAIEVVGRSEGRFGDLVRGRLAAGHKVYRSTGLIDVNFNSTVVATS